MAKQAGPWYREERKGWFVTLGGKKYPLGAHPPDAPRPQKSKKTGRWNVPKSIQEAFGRLLQGGTKSTADDEAVVPVLDDFLTWCKENREPRTFLRPRLGFSSWTFSPNGFGRGSGL